MADVLFWNDLRQRLDGVLVEQQAMSISDYLSIGNTVSQHVQRAKAGMAAEEVRQWVAAYVNGHLGVVAQRMQKLERGAPLIAAYIAQWQHFAQASQALSGSLSRAVGSGMHEAMVQAWYTTVFRRIATSIAAAAMTLVDEARKGGGVDDPQLLSTLHGTLAELRPAHAPELPGGKPLGVYVAWYLEPYVWAAVRHIDSCTRHLRTPGSTREYIRVVTRLLDDEERRGAAYLRAESVDDLRCVLAQRFVAGNLAAIHAEVARMLGSSQEDLRSVFCLLRRVPADRAAMQPLRDAFKAYVAEHTLAAMPSLVELNPGDASVSSLAFARNAVDWLLAELGRRQEMTLRCFDDEPGFRASLDAGLREAINSGRLMGPDHPQLQAPRLLAGYFGLLLQPDSALAQELAAVHPTSFESAVESRVRDALQLCELVSSKDRLMRHYKSLLARRLITDSGSNADLESAVVNMLALPMGFENTLQVSNMLTDISLSQDFSAQYRPILSSASMDVAVKILGSRWWSENLISESSPGLIVPQQVSAACDRLAELYAAGRNNASSGRRKLQWQWQWSYSKATIQLYFPHSVGRAAQTGYTIITNAYQLSILALFTDMSCLGFASRQLTPDVISRSIKLDLATVNMELAVLMRAGLLVTDSGSGAVMMNSSFNSRRLRIDISGIKRKCQESVAETREIDSRVDKHRFGLVKAAIVDALKRRSRMHHKDLLELVTVKCSRTFVVDRTVFKNAIGFLTEEEYICKSKDDFNVYEYFVKL
ncbi:ubiquitin ligase (cullin) of SCF [Coemansia sp. 'formosensis']|nr:ubiquitin ligase (cullin) of SCF [Coemansia sp. 'formosensis']